MNVRPAFVVVAALACAQLQAGETTGAGLDLIVMIDRSQSMKGMPVALAPAVAAELAAHNARSNGATHRLAVITFGSGVQLERPLSTVRDADARQLTETSLPAARGHTDVLAAFETAAQLFHSVPGSSARRRAIVVITDGVVYVPGRDAREYGDSLRRFVRTNLADTSIDVLFVRRDDVWTDALWRELSADGLHDAAGSRDDLLATVHRTVAALVGTPRTESRREGDAEVIVVPPYLDLVVFDIFQGARRGAVTVVPPDGSTNDMKVVSVGEALSTVIVNDPQPGIWTFRASTSGARVRVFAQQFFPRGVMVVPAMSTQLRQHDRVAVAYRVIDRKGRPITEIAGYPLALDLQITTPKGDRLVASMVRRPGSSPAAFAADTVMSCDLPGRYWTEVRITTRDIRQERVEVFRDRWSGFSVAEASLIDCRLTPQPVPPLFVSRSVGTRLDCLEAGHALELGPASADLFRASLERNGAPVASAVAFEYLGRGQFAGAVHGAGLPGAYTLQLAVDRSRLRGPYNIRILPAEMSFTRAVSWYDCGVMLASLVVSSVVVLAVFRVARRPKKDPLTP